MVGEVVLPSESGKYAFVYVEKGNELLFRFTPLTFANAHNFSHLPLLIDIARELRVSVFDLMYAKNRGGGYALIDSREKLVSLDGRSGLIGKYDEKIMKRICENCGWRIE